MGPQGTGCRHTLSVAVGNRVITSGTTSPVTASATECAAIWSVPTSGAAH